jgi:Coenzyme PQQ synthesis protein D (PqqD)
MEDPGADSFIPIPNRNVIVQDVLEEVLIYDLEKNIVRRLNRIAAAVWKECDGRKNAGEIARAVAPRFEGKVDEQTVLLALRQFTKSHLLRGGTPGLASARAVSRRELIKRLGIAAVPVVTSMIVPTAARAASCLPAGRNCSSNNQCCSGLCLPGALGIGICT